MFFWKRRTPPRCCSVIRRAISGDGEKPEKSAISNCPMSTSAVRGDTDRRIAGLLTEFRQDNRNREPPAAADDLHLHAVPRLLLEERPPQVVDALNRLAVDADDDVVGLHAGGGRRAARRDVLHDDAVVCGQAVGLLDLRVNLDRKSTRLNSSHQIISYA